MVYFSLLYHRENFIQGGILNFVTIFIIHPRKIRAIYLHSPDNIS